MNIRINSLTLTNFKCFRSKEFTFKDDITTIRGRNGVGKTTIFDAILFCLFGKNSQDQTKFDIKTHDEQGNVIPHLDHSVQLDLHIEGEYEHEDRDVTLIHSVKEKWTKKRGSVEEVFSGDTHEYFVNGELYTAADYKKYIASLIDEQTFRILTNPQYFPSLKWQDQRIILTQMVGRITGEDIVKEYGDDNLSYALRQHLESSGEDIVAYKKHLGYQIKQIKEKLEKIPVRMEEQNKALPEKLNWDSIQGELDTTTAQLKDLEGWIAKIQHGNGSDVKREEIRKQIYDLNNIIDNLIDKAREHERDVVYLHQQKVQQASAKFSEALNNQRLMEQTISADEKIIQRCEETITECGAELEHLRIAWPTRKFECDPNIGICPTCGQPLPPDQLEDLKTKMRENFNKALESEKQSLREKAAKVKKDIEDAGKELETSKQKLSDDKEKLETIKKEINTIFAEKAELEKEKLPDYKEYLEKSEVYLQAINNRQKLNDSLNSIEDESVDKEKLAELEANKKEYQEQIAIFNQKIASKAQYDKVMSLISGIEAEQQDLVKQLSELEQKEDIARQYEDRQNTILEERVNEHFQITRWKMFRTVVNNGDPYNEPFCECYDVNGTAYHDGLNQAARLNIGLDIINAMCRIYHVSAPVIIDQSESTLDILPSTGQQIRLQVFDSELNLV